MRSLSGARVRDTHHLQAELITSSAGGCTLGRQPSGVVTMDSGEKQRVKDALIAQAESELRDSRASVTGEDSAAVLDQNSSYSRDDQSQSTVAADLGGLLEGAEERQREILAQIQALDFGPKTEVAPGAVVSLDGDRYVIGVVSASFTCDGTSYEGISADSPLYASIKGLRTGDAFTFAGREHHIDFVA
jgi:hypothetical protein